jgi:Na+/melibiose symporter-like transporter
MGQSKDKEIEVKDKIGFGEYAAFGIGGVGVRMMFSITGAYFLMYMTNVAYLDVATILLGSLCMFYIDFDYFPCVLRSRKEVSRSVS